MKKRWIIVCVCMVVLLAVMPVLVTGCASTGGRYLVTMSVEKQTDTAFSMEYASFDGYRIYKFDLAKTTEVNIRFETESGRLDCLITYRDGEVFYESENIQTSGFGMGFPKGSYTVRMTGDKHRGSFSFDW